MRNLVRIALIVASSLVMTGLAVHSAVAGLSGCDNCITAGDIATDAVGAAEIKAGAVRKAEIASGAVGGSEIINGSIDTDEIANGNITLAKIAAGAVGAAGSVALSGEITTAGVQTIDSFDVVVPGSGYLLVSVAGSVWIDEDSGSTSSTQDWPAFGICTTAASSGSCGGTWYPLAYEDPDNANPVNATKSFTIQRVIEVTAGTTSLYFNGQKDGGNIYISGGYDGGNVLATVVFVPRSLSVTSPSAASPAKASRQ